MSIFVNEETKEGLYAIRYENEEEMNIIDCWICGQIMKLLERI